MKKTAIIIPTTAGLRRVCSARFREELPVSLIRLDGSFTPFSQSQAAHQLVDGPLRHLAPDGHSFDLALDGDIEDGRSWELGFSTAWGFARFWPASLASNLDKAERLLWITGAIDMDLAPQAAAYFIADKLKLSQALFEQARQQGLEITVVAPPGLGSDDEAALSAMSDMGDIQVLRPTSLQSLFDALSGEDSTSQPGPRQTTPPAKAMDPTPQRDASTQAEPAEFGSAAMPQSTTNRLAQLALPMAGGLLLLTLVGLGLMWALAGRTQPLTLGLIAHHLVDDTKTCGDFIFGQANLSPAVQQDLQDGDSLALAAQGLCQIEIVNTSGQALSLGLPPALSALALHDMFRQEAKIPMVEGARLAVLVSAFPPKQRMAMSVSAASGAKGAFTLDFQ